MGVEYQNLMNEMKSGSRKPSAMNQKSNEPLKLSVIKESQLSLNKPTTIHIASNLDEIEQKLVEIRKKRQEDNKSILE